MAMESYETGTGQGLWVHSKDACDADPARDLWCVIHARKPGHMQTWPTHWRSDYFGFMEVLCPHGIGHPAPENTGSGAHGCDGCCFEKEEDMPAPLIHTGAPGDKQEYLVRQGGLMRCCLSTLANYHVHAEFGTMGQPVEGQILPCHSCSSSMVFVDGAWEWNKAKTDYRLRGGQ